MLEAFVAHPARVGETYVQHLRTASGFALQLFAAALLCAVHAILPFLFEHSASRRVRRLHERMLHTGRTFIASRKAGIVSSGR